MQLKAPNIYCFKAVFQYLSLFFTLKILETGKFVHMLLHSTTLQSPSSNEKKYKIQTDTFCVAETYSLLILKSNFSSKKDFKMKTP